MSKNFKISILNLDCGNLSSIYNAFNYLGINVKIINHETNLLDSEALVIPGNGNFNYVMNYIKSKNIFDKLQEFCLVKKKPYLGICIGFQILFSNSLEDNISTTGLNFIKGSLKPFENKKKISNFSIPHIGWNSINIKKSNKLFDSAVNSKLDFYFMHSYISNDILNPSVTSTCEYSEEFISSVEKENISGIQFHPEKSHDRGINLLKNWIKSAKN